MTQAEAATAVAYLNAAFPRDALEPESTAIWVSEVMDLAHAPSGLDAAKVIGRNGDRFPTIREFRQAYRQAFDRHLAGRELEAPVEAVPPPPEFAETWAKIQREGVTRSLDDAPIPATKSMPARPVWERHERRSTIRELLPPSDAEIHDAILVLRDHVPGDDTYVGVALHTEASMIMDEASAA